MKKPWPLQQKWGVRLDAPEKSLQSKALAIIEGLGGKDCWMAPKPMMRY